MSESREGYAARMGELVRRAKSSTPIEPAQPVLMPGEPEALREAENRRIGVEMPADVAEALRQEASRLGIRFEDF